MKRHPFSPARLVLGLALIGIAALYAVTATGRWHLPLSLLLPLVPLALLLAGATAAATQLLRPDTRSDRPVDSEDHRA